MVCFNDNREIAFPEGFEVKRIENAIYSRRVSNLQIPVISTSLLDQGMKQTSPRRDELKEQEYIDAMKELQIVVLWIVSNE